MKKIGIFTTNESFAREQIKDMIWYYDKSHICTVKQLIAKDNISVKFSNEDYYEWIKLNSSSNARVTDAIIDIGTCSFEEISIIILPSIVNFEREPEITIVDSNPDKKFYNIDTLIDRLTKVRFIKGNLEVCYRDTDWRDTEIDDIVITNNNQLRLL